MLIQYSRKYLSIMPTIQSPAKNLWPQRWSAPARSTESIRRGWSSTLSTAGCPRCSIAKKGRPRAVPRTTYPNPSPSQAVRIHNGAPREPGSKAHLLATKVARLQQAAHQRTGCNPGPSLHTNFGVARPAPVCGAPLGQTMPRAKSSGGVGEGGVGVSVVCRSFSPAPPPRARGSWEPCGGQRPRRQGGPHPVRPRRARVKKSLV